MKKIQIPKGLFDIIPHDPQEPWKESGVWQYVENMARQSAQLFNFLEYRTPIFEKTELFTGTSGDSSDIVTKEMYEFLDKAGRSMTLRPEGTAPVMRSFIEKHLYQDNKFHKFFYLAPMFRYGRQQAGRYRQHHQFGAECIGSPYPVRDAEVIHLLYSFYHSLGIKNLRLYINSVGDQDCRERYKQAFMEYLDPLYDQLSEYSRLRLKKNPLRILDSKEPEDKDIVKKAPSILDFLSLESQNHFRSTCNYLDDLNIPYTIEPTLVRGLDYYTRSVFEFVAGELGAQNTIGGGGRYNKLIASLGGPSLPAVGFGTGLERVLQTLLHQKIEIPKPHRPILVLICLEEGPTRAGFSLIKQLREKGISCEGVFNQKKLKNALKTVDKFNPIYRGILGPNELHSQKLSLTLLENKQESEVAFSQLANFFLPSNPHN